MNLGNSNDSTPKGIQRRISANHKDGNGGTDRRITYCQLAHQMRFIGLDQPNEEPPAPVAMGNRYGRQLTM